MFRLPVRSIVRSLRTRPALHRTYSSAAAALQFRADRKLLGYSVKQVEEIKELNLTAVHLEHVATGAQHLHLACDDANNFFGVSFRTPVSDSSGVPHILEHLSLCGSRSFPCRDPFFNMLDRSMATFMNAFTGSDVTIYVFSTQNPKDFQNLLSVYLDATFFPSLKEIDFRQEGWRLEHQDVNDRTSPIVFKGVVFNEMKGVFGDASQYYARSLQNLLFPCNAYAHESGGDPLHIPSLSHQGLRDFHSQHYHPSNSRFVTYGNLPLEQHLEKIESHILTNFQRKQVDNSVSHVKPWTEPREQTIFYKFDPMAAVPEKQTMVSNSYVLNDITDTYENFALSILGTLLVDGPNAPFYQNLLESSIGPDYSPCTGFDSRLKQSVFSVGLREIAEQDVTQVQEIVASTFNQVMETGFPERQVQSVLHNLELATKHQKSNFGLSCCLGVSSLWNHDGNPVAAFRINDHIRWLVQQMKDNPLFFQDKVAQYFKSNPHKLTLVMKPDDQFERREQEAESQLLSSRVSALTEADRDAIYRQGLELLEHQKHTDPSCLPTLRISDVQEHLEKVPLKFTSMGGGVSVQLCEQPTNEVVYFRALLDASSVPQEDLMLLPLFCDVITQMGAGERDYKAFDQEVQLKTGGLGVSLHLSEDVEHPERFHQEIRLSSYCLEKNTDDMFSLWEDIFNRVCLEDGDRLTQLVRLGAAEMAQSIAHRGHLYSMRRSCAPLSLCAQRRESTSGLTQISYMKELAEMKSHEEIICRLKNLANLLFNKSSIRCSLNATPAAMPTVSESLGRFLGRVEASGSSPSHPPQQQCEDEKECKAKTHFVLPLPVNFLGQSIPTVPYSHPHFASLKVASKLMSSKFLHGEIREKGGAYGGGASISKGGHFMFYSYRDPNVAKTLQSFSSGVEWLAEGKFSDRDIGEAKLGVLKETDAPVPPGSKGSLFFEERISYEAKEKTRRQILECTRQDLVQAAQKYLKNSPKIGTALIGPENQLTTSEDKSWTVISN